MEERAWERFRQSEPTQTADVEILCYADRRMFLPEFTDMPESMQQIFQGEDRISLPCQRSGFMGLDCELCVFGEVVE